MKTATTRILSLCLLVFAVACDQGEPEGVVARAGDHRLTVDQTARMLAGVAELPAETQVVGAFAELWTDYVLLAQAFAEDSTLTQLDFEPVLRAQLEQQMILALRDSVISTDTTVSEAELRVLYDEQTPGARVRARHILLTYPNQATVTQRDSVRTRAQELLERVQGGADFDALARQYSQDPGSAAQGGDLGFFERGDMVKPFEDAAFAQDPGEVSDLVESPYGIHIIRTEEKEVPGFDEVRGTFRDRILERRLQQAESSYVATLEDEMAAAVEEDVIDIVRQVARNPSMQLAPRARGRAVARYEGGALTVGELRDFMATRPAEYRGQVIEAPEDVIENQVLLGLVQRKLLVARAREAGLEPTQEYRDTVTKVVRERLQDAARTANLTNIEPRESESLQEAIARRVEEVLTATVAGRSAVVPVGPLSQPLREGADVRVFDETFPMAVQEIRNRRGASGATPPAGGGAAPSAPTGGAAPGAAPPAQGGSGGSGG